jgi:hypothetical protein
MHGRANVVKETKTNLVLRGLMRAALFTTYLVSISLCRLPFSLILPMLVVCASLQAFVCS